GSVQPTYRGGGDDAFVTRLDAAGRTLLSSTFLGGGATDRGAGIALDPADNAYITGITGSVDFPTTKGAVQPTSGGGGDDAFVTDLGPPAPGRIGGLDRQAAWGVGAQPSAAAAEEAHHQLVDAVGGDGGRHRGDPPCRALRVGTVDRGLVRLPARPEGARRRAGDEGEALQIVGRGLERRDHAGMALAEPVHELGVVGIRRGQAADPREVGGGGRDDLGRPAVHRAAVAHQVANLPGGAGGNRGVGPRRRRRGGEQLAIAAERLDVLGDLHG